MNSRLDAKRFDRKKTWGLLVVGLLWGIGVGCFLLDWSSVWQRSRSSKTDQYYWMLECWIVMPFLGLLAGIFADWRITNESVRRNLVFSGSMLLFFAAILSQLLGPVYQAVR